MLDSDLDKIAEAIRLLSDEGILTQAEKEVCAGRWLLLVYEREKKLKDAV
jgi:hypothetical protein